MTVKLRVYWFPPSSGAEWSGGAFSQCDGGVGVLCHCEHFVSSAQLGSGGCTPSPHTPNPPFFNAAKLIENTPTIWFLKTMDSRQTLKV